LYKHLGVRFVYEASEGQKERFPEKTELNLAALETLPPELLEELKYAASTTDINKILAITEQIRPAHAALADALASLARNFEYMTIMGCIQDIKEAQK
jgi:hypothetical protein